MRLLAPAVAGRARRRGAAASGKEAPAPAKAPRTRAGYFPFIRVNVRHEFFNRAKFDLAKGVCDELDIQPTPQTRRRLALFGMIARCRPDGLDIVWDRARANQAGTQLRRIILDPKSRKARLDSLRRLLVEPPLLFTVALANPRFANFTDMPSDFPIGEPPLMLSNRAATERRKEKRSADLIIDWPDKATREKQAEAEAKAKRAREARKSKEAEGSKEAREAKWARWAKDPKWAKWAKEAKKAEQAEEAEEARKAEQAEEALEAKASAPGGPVRAIDNGPAVAEREHLLERSHHFALLDLYLVGEARGAAAAGRWDGMPISLDPGGAGEPAGKNGIFRPCTYTLGFEARRTRWRYFVATRDGSDPEAMDLKVVAPGGGDAGFERTRKRRILPDGRAALCLASTRPLPILARPEHELSLTGVSRGGRQRNGTLVDRLPAPSTDSISPARSPAGEAGGNAGGDKIRPAWSDIYVFV